MNIHDAERDHKLVSAIEIVSPANKDRPGNRNAFVGKCSAPLNHGIGVSIVDIVTTRQFNLYAERMNSLEHPDLLGPDAGGVGE